MTNSIETGRGDRSDAIDEKQKDSSISSNLPSIGLRKTPPYRATVKIMPRSIGMSVRASLGSSVVLGDLRTLGGFFDISILGRHPLIEISTELVKVW
jgi:hypothetical protein